MIPCDKKKLPTLSFVGGSTKTLRFRILNESGVPIDISQCTARFSLIDSVNKFGLPIFPPKEMFQYASNVLTVELEASDTVNLFGKYIYQVCIVGADGTVEEPQQGYMYIYNNIDKNFIERGE